ncbi:MAG: lysophospholipid acyltransferase family protein [Candidatus Binatia bacterium]
MRATELRAGGVRRWRGEMVRTPVYTTAARIVGLAMAGLIRHRVHVWRGGEPTEHALGLFQSWCRDTCRRLGVAVAVSGRTAAERCVYVVNHRSYLDIPVLGGALGAAFLSRADLARWPLVGAAARAIGTVFVERGRATSRALAARALARRLRSGSVVVFPEGTTGAERLPGAFAGGLFRLLCRVRTPVVPVTIRYSDRRAYWTDGSPITWHLREFLSVARRSAAVHIGAPLCPGELRDAAALAAASYAAVCTPIEALGELDVQDASTRRREGR